MLNARQAKDLALEQEAPELFYRRINVYIINSQLGMILG
jgi:hypothetical protein